MDTQPATPASPPLDAPPAVGTEPSRAQREAQLAMLWRLGELGMDVAEAIGRRARLVLSDTAGAPEGSAPAEEPVETEDRAEDEAEGDAPEAADPHNLDRLALAFSRVSRAVRLTIMLRDRLIEALRKQDGDVARKARAAAVNEAFDRPEAEEARKERIERILGRVAAGENDDAEACEQVLREAAERLDDDTLYGDLLDRPVSEIIDRLCRDLGLSPDWPRLTEEAWARQEISSGAIGSPLVNLEAMPAARPLSPKIPRRTPAKPPPVPEPEPPEPEPPPPIPPEPEPPWIDPMIAAELGPRGRGRNPWE